MNVMDYQTLTGEGPTREQAAMMGLGQSGINRYNDLSGILNEYGVEQEGGGQYGTMRGEEAYTPRSWDFNEDAFMSEHGTQSQNYQDQLTREAATTEAARHQRVIDEQAQARVDEDTRQRELAQAQSDWDMEQMRQLVMGGRNESGPRPT